MFELNFRCLTKILLLFFLLASSSCSSRYLKKEVDYTKTWLRKNILNSERIKEKFGSYGINALFVDNDSGMRLSNLYSIHDGENIMRTLALVKFENNINKILKNVHEEVLNGASIGSTLVKYGFKLEKNISALGISKATPEKITDMMKISNENDLATLVYDLVAIKDEKSFPYCTITEIYSPEYLTLGELQTLYGYVANEKINSNLELIKAIQ